MASLVIEGRLDATHMDHKSGRSLKDPDDLTIEDFIPSCYEKSYMLDSLTSYFANRLVERHPTVFKSIKPYVRMNKPHQFEEEMSKKSKVFTGDLFTKSESNTEDVVSMIIEVQDKFAHVYTDEQGNEKSYEKKVLGGDNKTEKNSHHGILR